VCRATAAERDWRRPVVCSALLSEVAQENVPDPERPRANNAAMQSEYARLAGMSAAALTAAMEPDLPDHPRPLPPWIGGEAGPAQARAETGEASAGLMDVPIARVSRETRVLACIVARAVFPQSA